MTTDTMEPLAEDAAQLDTNSAPICQPADPVGHLARCAECDFAVRFKPSATGASFVLVDSDRALGIGEHGRPTCPEGHGEMEIADDRLPIEQAMEQTAERLDATKQRLPFPSPPFNYEGALHEIFEKQKAVAILEAKFNDADDRRKKAKAALDAGHSELSALIETLQEREDDRLHEIARREADAAAGHPQDTNLVRCAWEQAHPDETCPVCAVGLNSAARDSSAHIEEVDERLLTEQLQAVIDTLDDVNIVVTMETIRGLTAEQLYSVIEWAEASGRYKQEQESGIDVIEVEVPARPACLGTAHVAAGVTTSEAPPGDTYQSCRECGARLLSGKTGDGDVPEPYPAGTLVGTDCPGAEKEPARQLPKRGKKKGAK